MRCTAPKTIWPHRSVEWCDRNEEYPISVPCGKCVACLSNKRADWCFRLEQEFKYSSAAKFVTLTIDEKHLRSDRSLCKRDVQLYLKRLRKRDGTNKLRYYAVGEYGSKTGRPHYHILLFNCQDEKNIRAAWVDSKQNPIGLVHIGNVTSASVAYVTKYMVQPVDELADREPGFALMSRSFGIGGRYLSDQMVEWHRGGRYNFAVRDGKKIRLPRFYKDKIWYRPEDREAVSRESMKRALANQEKEREVLIEHFGDEWQDKYKDMRDAFLSRVRVKVAFTQMF